jgi:hypothetical protein
VVDNIYQYSVLHYLLQLSNNSDVNPHPSAKTLTQGLMSESMAKRAIKELQTKGYISHKNHGWQSNEYTINREKIYKDLEQSDTTCTNNKVRGTRLKSKYSTKQKQIMALQTDLEYPEVAHKAEFIMGFDVSKDGKPINNEATNFKKYRSNGEKGNA